MPTQPLLLGPSLQYAIGVDGRKVNGLVNQPSIQTQIMTQRDSFHLCLAHEWSNNGEVEGLCTLYRTIAYLIRNTQNKQLKWHISWIDTTWCCDGDTSWLLWLRPLTCACTSLDIECWYCRLNEWFVRYSSTVVVIQPVIDSPWLLVLWQLVWPPIFAYVFFVSHLLTCFGFGLFYLFYHFHFF